VYSIDLYKKIRTKKGRRQANLFFCEGEKQVAQICAAAPGMIEEIICTETGSRVCGFPVKTVTSQQFKKISSVKTPQGIGALVRIPEAVYSSTLPEQPGTHILLLDGIQDPGNVGTLIRTAAAFGFSGIILSDKCADPFAPKVVQAAAGTLLAVWIRKTGHHISLAATLQSRGWTIAAADLSASEEAEVLGSMPSLVLVLGSEGLGVSKAMLEMADRRVHIPMDRSQAESLNVAVSGAVCMYTASHTK